MSRCEQFSLFPENFALSDDGFSGICGEFADAGDIDHRLFAAPRSNEIVRLADKVGEPAEFGKNRTLRFSG